MLGKVWHIAKADIFIGLPVCGIKECAEDEIPEDNIVAVVGVGLLKSSGVVPAVKLRHAKDVVERAELQVDIAVLEEPVNRDPGGEQEQDLFTRPQYHQRHHADGEEDSDIQGVEASGIEPIESCCAVMNGVKTPQQGLFVHEAMSPVFTELADHQGEPKLHGYGPVLWPQASAVGCA